MLCCDLNIEEYLDDFLRDGDLPNSLKGYMLDNSRKIRRRLFRGLPYPEEDIFEGEIIEERGGSTHWSYSEDIAIEFASDDVEDGEVPLILYAKKLKGFDVAPYIEDSHLFELYGDEEEVVVIGNDFEIVLVYTDMIDGVDYYFAEVKPIKRG